MAGAELRPAAGPVTTWDSGTCRAGASGGVRSCRSRIWEPPAEALEGDSARPPGASQAQRQQPAWIWTWRPQWPARLPPATL